MEARMRRRQRRATRAAKDVAEPRLTGTVAGLRKAGVETVETQTVHTTNHALAEELLDLARRKRCGTIVVGQTPFSPLGELVKTNLGERLVRKGVHRRPGSP
jgi:hypothetical protein